MKKQVICVITMLFLIGCTAANDETERSAQEWLTLTRNNLANQESYAFDGTFKRVTDSYNSQHEQIFTGRVQNRNEIYIKVDRNQENQAEMSEYSVLSKSGTIFEKKSANSQWVMSPKHIDSQERIKEWDPNHYFQLMENWRTSVQMMNQAPPVSIPIQEIRDDYLTALRVRLDPDKVKPWFIKQMHEDEIKLGVDDIRNLNAFFHVFVNEKSSLPTKIELHVNFDYASEGEVVRERRAMDLYFRDYGSEFEMPAIQESLSFTSYEMEA